jgi:hypothetical protein
VIVQKLRSLLAGVGGGRAALALFAVGWGLHTLSAAIDERSAVIDAQAGALKQAEAYQRELDDKIMAAQNDLARLRLQAISEQTAAATEQRRVDDLLAEPVTAVDETEQGARA